VPSLRASASGPLDHDHLIAWAFLEPRQHAAPCCSHHKTGGLHDVTSPDDRHVPTGTLSVLAQRLGTVCASRSTWYRLVQQYGWRGPRLRVHPVKPKVGLRTTRADDMWHIDTAVIRLLDGTRAYLHAVIDNLSRRILAWRVADTFAPVNSVAVLVDASRGVAPSETAPVVLADAGVEHVNAQVDDLITVGVLRRVLAFTELKLSNSMIEAWWRSLKHQWLFLHSLDSVATVRRPVAFYVDEHHRVLPHSAVRGQTPDEMYFGTGDAVPADLTSRGRRAPSTRRGQPIGGLRDMPVSRRGRMITDGVTAPSATGLVDSRPWRRQP
jgi:putative transposase